MTSDPLPAPLATEVLDVAPVGIAMITAPGTISWANPAYFEITGRGLDTVGRDFHELLDSEGSWSKPIGDAVESALHDRQASSFQSIRARYRSAPGGAFLDVDVRPLPPMPETPARAVLMIRDVTDRVAEHERATIFQESFRSSTNAIQLTDPDGVMLDVNPAYERIYGYSREECIGRRPNLVRSRFTPVELYEQMWGDLKDPARGFWSGELLNRDRSGRERPVLLTITAIRNPGGRVTHYLGVAVDRSEQRNWERRVAHSDKLASIGQLAAGVAHEINTPLANVVLVAESIRRRTTDPAILSRLEKLTGQVDVAAHIVRSLLDFSRREEPKVQEVDLAEVARTTVEFLRGKRSADVEILESYPADGAPILGDRVQLLQVMTNLLNNAYDAIAREGTIRVEVQRRARTVEVTVSDSGSGIPPEVLPHLFEPFYTTKPEGNGTGLGLAVCLGIVQSHHGSIVAANVPGSGARFMVRLPLRNNGAPRSPKAGPVGPRSAAPPVGIDSAPGDP